MTFTNTLLLITTVVFSKTILSSSTEVEWYCATECLADDADPCGDKFGQMATCTATSSDDWEDEKENLGYDVDSTLPSGFLGCTKESCASYCSSATGTFDAVETDGKKTFCFDGTEMFNNKDHAEMSAISRGCGGSHMMGSSYMHGSGHMTCSNSYQDDGVPYKAEMSSVDVSSSLFTSKIVISMIALVAV